MLRAGAKVATAARTVVSNLVAREATSVRWSSHRACGLVGMPNVGKSTLFNALTHTQQAQAANFPFCTIEPNVARVAVPDDRLDTLAKIAGSAQTVPYQIEFNDIAGLVKGASQGSGLGNKFLGHIRNTSVILQVVRCYDDPNVIHVENTVDPIRDMAIINTELILADLDVVERRLATMGKKKTKENEKLVPVLQAAQAVLSEGVAARKAEIDASDRDLFDQLQLLTAKPMLYVCNVAENDAATGNAMTKAVEQAVAEEFGESGHCLTVSAQMEQESAAFEDREARMEYLKEFGLTTTGLDRVIQASAKLLNLLTFYTVGPQEARAWSIPNGSPAVQAAGTIHSDFARGFIRAETIAYNDFINNGGEAGCKAAGLMRLEGKDYIVQDGDIMLFRFNV